VEEVVIMPNWSKRRVFVTGHTGFKGSWLALWLADAGAEVTGFSLPPPTRPNLFERARVAQMVHHIEGDIRDFASLERAMNEADPEVVFHMAAQALVRPSYETPIDTYATNVMGTVHVLEAARRQQNLKAIVSVTSDKCYENREWVWPYRENDPMGGYDPYSSSKGCAELVIAAYRRSFFGPGKSQALLASVRAGNVIGGGDWALDRLVPDIIRALQAGESPVLRSPKSYRPWQHVLDALGGYILLAEKLLEGRHALAEGWNFGPSDDDVRPVEWVTERLLALWGARQGWNLADGVQPHEARVLKLDTAKARSELEWRPKMGLETALHQVVEWYRAIGADGDARAICLEQIARYRSGQC